MIEETIDIIREFKNDRNVNYFITESNQIEGIFRSPILEESEEMLAFLELEEVKIADMISFVKVYQPDAVIRDKVGLDVRIGDHTPTPGGEKVLYQLDSLLKNLDNLTEWEAHCEYEKLHPFTDCNGRSGRMLWAWMTYKRRGIVFRSFLQQFYYQTLSQYEKGERNG